MKKEDIIVGEYLNNKLSYIDSTSKIFIEQDGWRYTSLLVTSQMPDRFITYKELIPNSVLIGTEDLIKELKGYNIEYLILKANTQLFTNFASLQEVIKFENWIIYKLH